MRVEINKELEKVSIDTGEIRFEDQNVQSFFDSSLDSTAELIRVLNFEYAPLYRSTKGLRQENQKQLAQRGLSIEKRKALVEDLMKIQDLERFDMYKLLVDYMEEEIGGNMKFANPIVWMMYKYYAYENGVMGAKPIKTLEDLINHCARETYICTKRFHYVNKWLEDNGYKSLRDGLEHGLETDLMEIFTDPKFIAIAMQEELMEVWNENERIGMDDIKKWEDYKEHLPEDRRSVSTVENRPFGSRLSFNR